MWGKCWRAAGGVAAGALPIGLAHGVNLRRPVTRDTVITRGDVEDPPDSPATRLRAETEAMVFHS